MKNKKVLFIYRLMEVLSVKVLLSTGWIRPNSLHYFSIFSPLCDREDQIQASDNNSSSKSESENRNLNQKRSSKTYLLMKSLGNQRGDIIQKSNSNENHQCITYTSSPEIAKVIENWEPRNIYFLICLLRGLL